MKTVSEELATRQAELAALCARFAIRRLELIGSAASGKFDPARSDLDFLVDLSDTDRMTPFEQYFGLKEELERLFSRPVDLVMDGASANPYFLKSIDKSRRLLYAA